MLLRCVYLLALLLSSTLAFASEEEHGDAAVAQAYIKELIKHAHHHNQMHGPKYLQELSKGQHPRATIVTCSDSRVHTDMLDSTPDGQLFMVRNIGNQVATAPGSVEYGVNHLHSSLLLILGHSACGAVKAASGDYSTLEEPIKHELDTIKIEKGVANIEGVKKNVHDQVAHALELFGDKVKENQLLIIGAVYDFTNDMKQGAGEVDVIDVNGDSDPDHIHAALSGSAKEK